MAEWTRKFGGKTYKFDGGHTNKINARKRAEYYRKRGFNVRVVEAPKTAKKVGTKYITFYRRK